MFQHLRDALVDKLEDQREQEPYCTIKWSDTKKIEVIPQNHIRLSPSHNPEINVTYTIVIDGVRRHGTVLAAGTKKQCDLVRYKLSPHEHRGHAADSPSSIKKSSSFDNDSNLLDDLILMKILARIITKSKSDNKDDEQDIHDAQCAACRMKPIRHVDRYRCLECSSSPGYDLCGRCFERRVETGRHLSGHAMIHFKLPNEFLGVHVNDIDQEISLNKLKYIKTLQYEQHDGIQCDGDCRQKNFVGLRFKCDICPNYNLCEICAIKKHVCTKMHQRDHPIILTSNRVMPKIDPQDIQMGEVLGRGAFGYVCKSLWRSKNRQVACKVIEVSGVSTNSSQLQRSFLLELAAYRELSGPYILRTFGYATHELPSNRTRGPTTQFMIIMELMERGSLQNVLDNEPVKLSLRRKLSMSRQIAAGMRRIHQHGMIHRDIRPDNILVSDDYIAKIGDMGIARVLDPKGQQTQMGCIQFMPPEFFEDSSDGHAHCDEKLDIYTYGLTMNQIFTESTHDFRFTASKPRMKITKESGILYEEIILRCLEYDSKRRPSAVEIEKTLELYEEAFKETMLSDEYTRMNTKEKDKVFIQFYLKNKSRIQRFVKEQFPTEFRIEIPVEVSNKQKQSVTIPISASNEEKIEDPCRLS